MAWKAFGLGGFAVIFDSRVANRERSPAAPNRRIFMRKIFIALVAAVTIAGSLATLPGQAEAGNRWVASAVVGGIVGGALIAGAAAPYYAPPPPPPYYAPAPAYYAPPCGWVKQRYWDGYYWRVRRVPAC
jgi:hypothetical protein